MISLEESLALYPRSVRPQPAREQSLADSLGQVLAAPVSSRVDLPMFTQSAVDGYALHSEDSSRDLRVAGEIAAGAPSDAPLARGSAMRIFTGGALPQGADTCARQEIVDRQGDVIRVRQLLKPGADTRFRGEEIKAGEVLAHPGQRLTSGLLSALTMAGVRDVRVAPKPRVAVIVTGDEVSSTGELGRGEIFDANGPLVCGWLREQHYPLASMARVRDDPESLQSALRSALADADVVLTTGGVSVGDRDHIPEVAAALGVRKVFWKVAQKPGKPLWFGVNDEGKALLGFPGNPAAVLIGLHLHARCLLAALEGEGGAQPRWQHGVLSSELNVDATRDRLVRVAVESREDGATVLLPLPRQDSHMLSNLATATALAWIRRDPKPPAAGSVVRWIPI